MTGPVPGGIARDWAGKGATAMRTIAVVVVDDLLQDGHKMAPVDHDQVIKALAAI